MLRLINRKDLMGEHCNTKTFNAIAWVTCGIIIALTALSAVTNLLPGRATVSGILHWLRWS